MELLRILQGLIPLIAPTLVFAASLYYLIRRQNLDSIFLSVGSGTGLIMTAIFTYLPYYAQHHAMTATSLSSYFAIGGIISLFGTVIFAVGLFMLIEKVIRLSAQEKLSKGHYNL